MVTTKDKKPSVFAVSGIKNSGKTTVIEKLVGALTQKGYTVGVIKHDGHDFVADHEGTDSWRHKQAGASRTLVYSETKCMLVQDHIRPRLEDMLSYMKGVDWVIVEGMKYSSLPKLEVVRQANGNNPVCDPDTVLAIATDVPNLESNRPLVGLDDLEGMLKIIEEWKREIEDDRWKSEKH